MTLAEAQKKASQTIEAAIGADHPRARGTYTYRMLQQYKAALTEIDKELSAFYAKYLTGPGIDPKIEIMKLKPGPGARISRLEALKRQATQIYNRYAPRANRIIANASTYAMTQQYYMNQYAVNWFGGNYFVAIPQEVVNISVFGGDDAWSRMSAASKKKYQEALRPSGTLNELFTRNSVIARKRINTAVSQGLINGWSYSRTAQLLTETFNKTIAGNALTAIRTESHRVSQAGAYVNSINARERGIPIVREWLEGGAQTPRQSHLDLDGTKEDKNGLWHLGGLSTAYPGGFGDPNEDINCTCVTLDTIDGVEPEARAGRNPVTGEMEIMDFKDYGQWSRDNGIRTP